MTRTFTHRFMPVLAAAVIAVASASSLAAERGPGGVRQQPLEPPARSGENPAVRPAKPPPSRPGITGMPGWSASRQPESGLQRPDPASFTHRGTRYLVSEGRWYEQRGTDLVAVNPPAGVLVETLPEGYSIRWVGGVPYFFADGLFFVWRERNRQYEILQNPPGAESSAAGETQRKSERNRSPKP